MHIIETTSGMVVKVVDGKPYNIPRGTIGTIIGRDGENVTVNVNGNNVVFNPAHLIIKDRPARISVYRGLVSSAESQIKHYKKTIKRLEKAKTVAEIAKEVRACGNLEDATALLTKYIED